MAPPLPRRAADHVDAQDEHCPGRGFRHGASTRRRLVEGKWIGLDPECTGGKGLRQGVVAALAFEKTNDRAAFGRKEQAIVAGVIPEVRKPVW